MRIRSVKAMCLKAAAATLLAGAVFAAAPTQASAQSFAVGVQFGHPGYSNGPVYGPGPGFYDRDRWQREQFAAERRDAWVRQEEWRSHEQWRDHHDFRGYPPRAVPFGGGWR